MRESPSAFRRYAVALASVAAATVLRLLLDPLLSDRFPFATLFFAVLVTTWYGGFGPALLATLAGGLAAFWFLLPPRNSPHVATMEYQAGLVLYFVVGLGLAWLGGSMRRAWRRAETKSREAIAQREQWRVTVESIGDGVITTDTAGRVTALNAVASQLTGWSAAEAVGRPLDEVFRICNEQTRLPVANPVHKVLREGRVVGLANHTVLLTRDGAERPIDDSAAPICDPGGRLIGVVLVFRDVSERRQAEARLRRSEQELADFFDNANVGLHWAGPDGVILRVNQAELDMLGYGSEEYVGRHIAEVHADAAAAADILKRMAAGEKLENYPARFRCRDGTIKDVLINSSVLWEDGRFVHTRCCTLDVTQQRAAERAQALLAAVVESSDDVIVSKSLDGVILSWNAAATRVFGWTAAEAVGRSISLIIPPERLQEETMILDQVRRGERVDHFQTVRQTKTGQRIDIALTVSPIRDSAGRIIGASKIARDISAQKKAEERLRILAAVVETGNDFVGICTPDLVPVYVNEAGRRMVGLDSSTDVAHTTVLDYFWPEDRPRIEQEAFPALEREGRWRGEVRFRHFQTGQPIHTLWNATVIRDDAGQVIAWATVSPNLDALKAVEQELQASQALLVAEAAALRGLHELSGRLLLSDDLAGSLQEVLDAVMNLVHADLGCVQLVDPNTGVLENIVQKGFPPDALSPVQQPGADQTAAGRCQRLGARLIIEDVEADPKYAPYRAAAAAAGFRAVQATPLVGRNGQLLGVLSTFFRQPGRPSERLLGLLDLYTRLAADFSERLGAEERLRASEERFRTLATNAPAAIFIKDLEGRYTLANPLACVALGRPEGAVGRTDHELLPADIADALRQRDTEVIATGQPIETEEIVSGPGFDRRFLSVKFPLRNADGRPTGVCGVAIDITGRKRAEEALKEADRRKDEFLATLAHELRNPLAPVRNSLEIMKRAGGDPRLLEQARITMDRQMTHLERLVDDLLDISRITRDKLELRKQRVELAVLVQQAVETCRPLAERAGHWLTVELPDVPVYLDADPVRLTQVFSNLLNNACKYTEPGGRIAFRAALAEGDTIRVEVQDNGLGIPAELLDRVFDMFTQVERSPERSQGGLGIGLTLVRRLVELHGGTVRAFSEGPGRGSRFEVRLPVATGEQESRPASETQTAGTGRHRILVVDDNRDAAESLAMLLQLNGHETYLAHDGLQAVEAAARDRPDIVLLDIGLPGLNGHDVARRIREQPWGREMMLVALTGWGQDHQRRKSKEVGFDHHLVKPVEPAALMELLANHTRP